MNDLTPGALAVFQWARAKMREPSGETCPRCGTGLDVGEVLTGHCRMCGSRSEDDRSAPRPDPEAGDGLPF